MAKLGVCFSLLVACLISLPPLLAYDFNFTGTPYVLISGTSGLDRTYAKQLNSIWNLPIVVTSSHGNISEFDTSFNLLNRTWLNGGGVYYTPTYPPFDCKYIEGISTNNFTCYIQEYQAGGTPYYHTSIVKYNLENNQQTLVDHYSKASTSGLDTSFGGAVCQDMPIIIWQKAGESDLRYTKTDDLNDNDGDGTIDLPATYENPEDIQVVYCGGALHLIIYKGGVFDLIYDYNTLEYKNIQALSVSSFYYPATQTAQQSYGVYEDGNTLYVTQSNTTGDNTANLFNIQSWSCDNNYEMTPIYSNNYHANLTDSNINGTYNMTKPFITKDEYGTWNLFYVLNNVTTSGYLKAITNQGQCYCGSWVSTGECNQNYEKYSRTCSPTGCNTNTTYWTPSTYCGIQYNQSQGVFTQNVTYFEDYQTCNSYVYANPLEIPIISCELQLPINLNCSSINVTSGMKLSVEYKDPYLSSSNTNNFTATICLPKTSCDTTTTYQCRDAKNSNITFSKTYNGGYVGGEKITFASSVAGGICGVENSKFLGLETGSEGWTGYTINAEAKYRCARVCGGYRCLSEGGVQYSTREYMDCSFNETDRTLCSAGCNSLSGLCNTVISTDTTPASIISSLLNPSALAKVVISLTVSAIGGLLLLGLGSSISKGIGGLLFMIGFGIGFIIFSFIGWIPAVFLIIIIFMVGLTFLFKTIT